MSWAEIKKAVNSDLSTPLNSKIDSQTTALANKFGLTFESRFAYNSNSATTFTPTKTGIIMVCLKNTSGFFRVTIGSDYFLINLGQQQAGEGIAIVKANETLTIVGNGTITYYSLGGGI